MDSVHAAMHRFFESQLAIIDSYNDALSSIFQWVLDPNLADVKNNVTM